MSSSAPSTATVLEFRCLFTHDLRRKQKRWQDGRLKYHSFNARVMVYDERGNSVGDMHWHGEYEFGEGEEIQLDRGGVIVQVEELVERRETDLTELVDKRIQEKQQRHIQQLARSVASGAMHSRPLPRPPPIAPDRLQPQRHQPLHHIIGTPTGHLGKALVPKESPYEQRQQATESPDDRATKRRKYGDPLSKRGYASALFGQTLTLSSATPSSSVPAIRRPRPEAPSDSRGEAETQNTREDPEPPGREQLQSPQRFNHSGYAQSLLGQTLNLSHTPVSSMSARAQRRAVQSSSPTIESDRQDPHGDTRTITLQQSPESCRTKQPGSKSRSSALHTRGSIGHEPEKGKVDGNVPRAERKKENVHRIPDNVDVIEIEDTEPVSFPTVRQQGAHVPTSAGLPGQNDHSDRSRASRELDRISHENVVRSTRHQRLDSNRGDETKKVKDHERTGKPKSTAPKSDSRNASSGLMGPSSHGKARDVRVMPRDPEVTVTELRIKSSKKRGLLMISDTSKPKKKCQKVTTDSPRPYERGFRHRSEDSEDEDDPFRSPSPQPASKFENGRNAGGAQCVTTDVSGSDDKICPHQPVLKHDVQLDKEKATNMFWKKPAQRTVSAEVGEIDGPYRSPPAISKQARTKPGPAQRDIDMLPKHAGGEQIDTIAQGTSCTGCPGGFDRGPEPGDTILPTKRPPSPPRAGYDPYRIPSSPQAPSPEILSSSKKRRHGYDFHDEIPKPLDSKNVPNKAKKRRTSRRKVVSDEDDDSDSESLVSLPKNTDSRSGFEKLATPNLDEETPEKQTRSREATRTKTRAQEAGSVSESGEERPERASRKCKGRQKELCDASDKDGLALNRRQSTRQMRSRAASYEERRLLWSEDDSSEEEEIPKKQRKTKMAKTSEHRPRFEKIKKNVKSRELVGFNLAALNAPLGLRGIGIPFSILPSPVIASIQKHPSNHSDKGEKLGGNITEGDGDEMSPTGPNTPAETCKPNAEAQRESATAKPKKNIPDHVILAHSENNRSETSAKHSLPSLDQPVQGKTPVLHKQLSTAPAQAMPEDTKSKTPKEARTSFQMPPAPLSASPETPSNLIGASQERLHGDDPPPSETGQTILGKTQVSARKAVAVKKIAADLFIDATIELQAATLPNQQKPSTQGESSATKHPHAPYTFVTDQNVSAGASTSSLTVQKRTPSLDRQSSNTDDQNDLVGEKAADESAPHATPALPVRQSKAIGLRRQALAPRRVNKILAELAPQSETTEVSPANLHRKSASNARLANPASRGRKAALASHAAGQVPQRILPPTQPTLMVPVSTADLAMTPIEQDPREPERPKKKMTFPGFQSARSDGPWSREAFDLLESGRPG